MNQFATDFSQGRHEPTGRALDLAIKGEGFFVYQGQSEPLYSRNGVLFRDEQGQLVNGDGLPIVGGGGPIEIPANVSDHDLVIESSGTISANGAEFGKLSVVTFNNNQLLESDSQTYFRAGTALATPNENATIAQGTRELSNAHPVTELISMIIGSRHFESCNAPFARFQKRYSKLQDPDAAGSSRLPWHDQSIFKKEFDCVKSILYQRYRDACPGTLD